MFVRNFVPFVELLQSFTLNNSSGVYISNHSSESIHIWTIGTMEGGARGQNLGHLFKKCFPTFSVMATTYAASW